MATTAAEKITVKVENIDMLAILKAVAAGNMFEHPYCNPNCYDAEVTFSATTVDGLADTDIEITLTKRPDFDEGDEDGEDVIEAGASDNLAAALCG